MSDCSERTRPNLKVERKRDGWFGEDRNWRDDIEIEADEKLREMDHGVLWREFGQYLLPIREFRFAIGNVNGGERYRSEFEFDEKLQREMREHASSEDWGALFKAMREIEKIDENPRKARKMKRGEFRLGMRVGDELAEKIRHLGKRNSVSPITEYQVVGSSAERVKVVNPRLFVEDEVLDKMLSLAVNEYQWRMLDARD